MLIRENYKKIYYLCHMLFFLSESAVSMYAKFIPRIKGPLQGHGQCSINITLWYNDIK